MKLYIALLQKERNKKPTIETIENQRISPTKLFLEDTQKSIDISAEFNKINIDTKAFEKIEPNVDVEVSESNHISSQPLLSTLIHQNNEEALPLLSQPDSPQQTSPLPQKLNDSILMQRSFLQEISLMNKTIIEKNCDHEPKQKIISSIRKFDDRCKIFKFILNFGDCIINFRHKFPQGPQKSG